VKNRSVSIAIGLLCVTATFTAAQPTTRAETRVTLPPLHHESVAFDAARGRLVVYGGSDSLKGTWEWDGTRWTQATDSASSPPVRGGATLGYDPSQRKLVMFGGWWAHPRAPDFRTFCDTWTFDGRRWDRVSDGPCVTDRVRNNSIVYEVRRRALYLLDGTPEVAPDTLRPLRIWRWSGASWALVDSLGPRREGWDRGVYDASRGVIVFPVFRGPDAGVWEWNGIGWRHLTPNGGPEARQAQALEYDPRRQRVVMIGGQTYDSPMKFLGDAWTWDGTRWAQLATPAGPNERSGGNLVDDPTRGRLLYFGGYKGPPMQLLQELWVLDRDAWTLWHP
jgi:hypothetical protein